MEAKLYGLVLAGGKSSRMGRDKGAISYYGMPQQEYLYDLLSKLCDTVFLSVQSNADINEFSEFNFIKDEDKLRGPMNGMHSAHSKFPDVAWLVLATDLPLITEKALQHLISERDSTKCATALATNKTKLPEPLCAIWEPESFAICNQFITETEKTCPRKFLLNHPVKIVFPEDDKVLLNANFPEDVEIAKTLLKEIYGEQIY